MHAAVRDGLNGDDALDLATEKGIIFDMPTVVDFIRDYIDARTG
jgi:hypothetical protein